MYTHGNYTFIETPEDLFQITEEMGILVFIDKEAAAAFFDAGYEEISNIFDELEYAGRMTTETAIEGLLS